MIDVVEYDDGLPISVIVPTSNDFLRKNFFENFVFPLIEANEPIEIIINDDLGSAPKKRNDGFRKSKQPFVFFCDNDILLPKNHLKNLLNVLIKNPDVAYTYSGYFGIVMDANNHPIKQNYLIQTMPFNAERLKKGNYISTMSLIRREAFPMFDENLKRYQDWDMYLTMLESKSKGMAVYNNEFYAYYLDSGITSNMNDEIDALNAIRLKHGF